MHNFWIAIFLISPIVYSSAMEILPNTPFPDNVETMPRYRIGKIMFLISAILFVGGIIGMATTTI